HRAQRPARRQGATPQQALYAAGADEKAARAAGRREGETSSQIRVAATRSESCSAIAAAAGRSCHPPSFPGRQDIEHDLRWTAQPYASGPNDDGAIDQDGVIDHEVDQLVIAPFGSIEPQLVVRRSSPSEQLTRGD